MGSINQRTEILDSLITSTFYKVRNEVIDNVFQITPFYDRLVEKGKIRERVPEGTHWEVPIRYAKEDANTKYFGRGASFGRAESETLTRLIFYTKNLGTSVVRYWDDDRKNRGKAKMIDYAEEKVQNAMDSLTDKMEVDLLNQNSDGLSIDAIPTLIADDPTTGSIGGLTRVGNEHLQNNYKSFSGLTTANSLLDEMTRMLNLCSLYKAGKQRTPDIIMTTREVYQDYEKIARAMQTIQTNKTERASLGFGDLLFKNVEVFWSPQCPSGKMYFLNSETLELSYDPDAWFEMTPWKTDPDTLDRVAQIVLVCNLTCNKPRKNGVIHSITTVTT